ncbi:hypothetical protein [Pandoraea sp.]|uniref:hypothetical protein n=1 Tax=Pandoraea sp. TaxID=1883445 RepID=UPI0025ED6101|nr:hypothetical protein [Pandoraea sp.]
MKTTRTFIAAIALCAAGILPAMAKANHPGSTMPAWVNQMWQSKHDAMQTDAHAQAPASGQSLPAGARHRP